MSPPLDQYFLWFFLHLCIKLHSIINLITVSTKYQYQISPPAATTAVWCLDNTGFKVKNGSNPVTMLEGSFIHPESFAGIKSLPEDFQVAASPVLYSLCAVKAVFMNNPLYILG